MNRDILAKFIILLGRKRFPIIKQLKSYRTQAGKKIIYVNIPESDARRGMKDMGMNEWFINIALDLFDNYRKGNASQVYDTVESITGNKPISFSQFTMDYAGVFR